MLVYFFFIFIYHLFPIQTQIESNKIKKLHRSIINTNNNNNNNNYSSSIK